MAAYIVLLLAVLSRILPLTFHSAGFNFTAVGGGLLFFGARRSRWQSVIAVLALTVGCMQAPGALVLALVLAIFGYGQGLVMAPLSSAVLSMVKPASAGSGAGMYGTTSQIANAAGVAAIGAAFFAIAVAHSARVALLASLALFMLSIFGCAAFLTWMRRAAACANQG